MVIGLTLALVAVLAIAPVLNDEMAYASNRPGGGGGGGGRIRYFYYSCTATVLVVIFIIVT